MDINTTLLALSLDTRLAHVPMYDVINALDTTTSTGLISIIKGNRSITIIRNLNVLCTINDAYTVNGKRVVIGNPCFVDAFGRLNIWQNTIAVAEANKAIVAEIIGNDAIENALYRD